jgi:hypothetical protein
MSQLTPVLYGNRLYGQETYSENADPVTTVLTISDSVSSADAFNDTVNKLLEEVITATEVALNNINKPLTDTTTVTDAFTATLAQLLSETITPSDSAITTTGTKPVIDGIALSESFVSTFVKILSDSVTMTDLDQKFVTRIVYDSLTVFDSNITVTITKALTDILLLQDWLSLRLSKPNNWIVNTTPIPVSTLYGRVLFGRSLYGQSNNRTPWNTTKPTLINPGWRNYNQLEEMP